MLEGVLAGLASAGGTALVTAMVTDGWEDIRTRFARLLGRGNAAETEAAAARLDESQALLGALAGGELQRARTEQEFAWRIRLGDLLERQPESEYELRRLVDEVRTREGGSAGSLEQHVTGSDHAQQAVQGHGLQVNTFGGQDERGAG